MLRATRDQHRREVKAHEAFRLPSLLHSRASGCGGAPAGAAAETHYSVLGVGLHSAGSELRAAFLRAAAVAHPDKPGGALPPPVAASRPREAPLIDDPSCHRVVLLAGSVEHFLRVQEAYRVLSNAHTRAAYDRSLQLGTP